MSLFIAWVLFPLALGATGAGWGLLVEKATGARVHDALLIPLGLAAVVVVTGLLTAFDATAMAGVPVAAAGAVIGLIWCRREFRLDSWAMLAALGALLVYGAPVLLSGQGATFLGYVRLDDTATWLDVVDHLFVHGPSTAHEAASTYSLVYSGDVGTIYPRGSFLLLGVGRALVGMDAAWVFQPYLACCAALIAMSVYALISKTVERPWLRALVAFLSAPAALLYGYSLWGGIKELSAAFLLVAGVALIAELLPRPPEHPRRVLPLAVGGGALVLTLGVGAAGWVIAAFAALAAIWLIPWPKERHTGEATRALGLLAGLTAVMIIPVWIILVTFVKKWGGLFSAGQSAHTRLGNLLAPLSVFQLGGIWPVGDFRDIAPTFWTTVLLLVVVVSAGYALWWTLSRGQFGLALYVVVAIGGAAVIYFSGATPWVTGKGLAIASPALLTAALTGAAILWARHWTFALVMAVLGVGIFASTYLQYHDVLIAPRARLAELQTIGNKLNGKGPTFLNDYEIYGDRHFLRAGEPVAPAEYRPVNLPTRQGVLLTQSAFADIDSFSLQTLMPYRSIVMRRSPVASRPPSIWSLVWQGTYYQLWQRPANPSVTIIEHVPYGDSNQDEYCGANEAGTESPLCPVHPVEIPSCPQVHQLAAQAKQDGAVLVAYQRPAPIVVHGDDTLWPGTWAHDPVGHSITPTTPGTAVSHILVNTNQPYALWLAGSFSRGFEVSVDGKHVGTVSNQLLPIGGWIHVADLTLAPGAHKVSLTYPQPTLAPGSGDNSFTTLSGIALDPLVNPPRVLLTVAPAHAQQLCGRPIDWIEIVRQNA
jgi:hypothetical protein